MSLICLSHCGTSPLHLFTSVPQYLYTSTPSSIHLRTIPPSLSLFPSSPATPSSQASFIPLSVFLAPSFHFHHRQSVITPLPYTHLQAQRNSSDTDSFPNPRDSPIPSLPLFAFSNICKHHVLKMTHILKIPPEVLAMCARYLKTSDLKNAMLVCKHFNTSIRMEIYQSIWWPNVVSIQDRWTCHPWSSASQVKTWKSQSFAQKIISSPWIASTVRRLEVDIEVCFECLAKMRNHEPSLTPDLCLDCSLILAAVQQFKCLKALTVGLFSEYVLPYLAFENLETLRFGDLRSSYPTQFGLQELLPYLRHPKLASLELSGRIEIVTLIRTPESSHQVHAGCKENVLGLNIKRLVLGGTRIDYKTLTTFLDQFRSLKTFVYTGVNHMGQKVVTNNLLPVALKPIQSSVQNLWLTIDHWVRGYEDDSPLTTLADFQSLKRLVLDSTMLFGKSLLDRRQALSWSSSPLRPPLLHTLLPESLEELTLFQKSIDFFEVRAQVEAYIEEIIGGKHPSRCLMQISMRQPYYVATYKRCQHDGGRPIKCYSDVTGWSRHFGQTSHCLEDLLGLDQPWELSTNTESSHKQKIVWYLFEGRPHGTPNPYLFAANECDSTNAT
jgi:hypothetical protein